jgi:acetylornithine aminotransferase
MATLTATGSRKVQAGFEPLLTGFARVPYNDIAAVQQVAAHNKNVVAVMVEPIQGEGGIQVPDAGYLATLRSICDTHGWLLMLDEVQTGMGRTGRWFAFQHEGIRPDVMSLAKGLGSGIPIGACLASGAAADVFKPGNHGSTFGGNPFACTAGLTTLATIEDEGLIANAEAVGALLREGLASGLAAVRGVKEIRGKGLMLGVELDRPCGELVKLALERGLLINVTAESVIRLLPPLVMTKAEAGQLLDALVLLVAEFMTAPAAAAQAVR